MGMRIALFCDITQRVVVATDVSGESFCPIGRGQGTSLLILDH